MTDGLTLEEISDSINWPLSYYNFIDRSGSDQTGIKMNGLEAIPGIASDESILEETFIHEAAHTSLDGIYSNDLDWKNAQKIDCQFISTYALENPNREDIAESYLSYFAVRYASRRISKKMINIIHNTIPERIKYFDKQEQNIYPFISDNNF